MSKSKYFPSNFVDDNVHLDSINEFSPNAQQREAMLHLKAQALEMKKLDLIVEEAFVFHEQGNLKQAVLLYEKVLGIYPKHIDALHLLGLACLQDKQYLNAVPFFSRALQVNPNDSSVHNHLGIVLDKLNLKDQAIVSFTKAIEISSDNSPAYSNRGVAYGALNQWEHALRDYQKAIDISPSFSLAHFNIGVAFRELNNLDSALSYYDQALKITPDDGQLMLNKAMLLLLNGDFKLGWPLYESRWKSPGITKRDFSQPLWLGDSPLHGKTILLYAEQGLGDTIQFGRYAELVAKQGAKVVLEVQPPLVNLLKNLPGVSQIIAKGDSLPYFDFHCPFLSLPLAFKTEVNTIPPVTLPVVSNTDVLEKWREILGPKTKPRVGLAWSGSPTHLNDLNRSINLSDLIQYLPKGIQYISLQKELRESDLQTLHDHNHLAGNETIFHFGFFIEDFTDTAALCQSMDLVISVDTSIAHLAASLQKPTWILLPFAPDWRWLMKDHRSSPWYPSVKLLRQIHKCDWKSLLASMKEDVQKWSRSLTKSV